MKPGSTAQPLTLVVMAAGIGRRYGSLKQIESVGPKGETLLDYAIYDAVRAGYSRIVFVVREGIEDFLRANIENKVGERAKIVYVYQELTRIPAGFTIPTNRQSHGGRSRRVVLSRCQTPFV
jgi:CTP:molybdopterin cytidylyltransferase MocA